jgi:hypothetical protein
MILFYTKYTGISIHPWPGQAGTKKTLACREIPKHKSQITNKSFALSGKRSL